MGEMTFFFISKSPFFLTFAKYPLYTSLETKYYMKLAILSPRKVLSKAYLRQTVVQKDIETFVTQLKRMFERVNEKESEENHKNLMSDFLKNVYYAHQYEINTKQRHDLVIHLGKSHQDAVGVIIESKKYTNKSEMISPEKSNVKALHELIRYYLMERLQDENHQVKHLIITDLYKCYIFDEVWFHQNIYENAALKKAYKDWKISGHTTDFFYKNIAAKGIEKLDKEIPCVCVDMFALYESVKDCAEINETLPNLPQIIDIYKLFSPQHLLKLAFSNDSNSLNKAFYNEFLHIIGLTEVKDGGKKLIQRKALADRESGSLLENALNQILLQQGNYAQLNENEYFSIALELCITWLNRILFLKLLEAQLIRYHTCIERSRNDGDRKYAFMNTEYIDQFDILNELFFEVMAIPQDQRRPEVVERYGHIPYLNSSLFDRSESEIRTHVSIANLKDRLEISLFGQTVLKDDNGTPLKGKMNTLRYLLAFLEAYNFGSNEEGQMQQDNKTLINAAVLGLIFEKINGYQDGSFFTPSYITMYMCRETLRRAAVQKIAEKEKVEIDNFEDLTAYCRRFYKKDDLLRLNTHLNSLKICDPAVGSGHFLVSALNELICIKSDLGILIDENGLPLRYQVTIENDELFVIDAQTNDLFEYQLDKQNRLIPQLQTVQKTLFEEKRNLIESCLFGVDINPKSVMICRLRLWIELLKNAYYFLDGQTLHLQTLPNIDINIKTGNSLIAKLHINDELNKFTSAQRQFVRNTLPKYKKQVELYKNAYDKATKAQIIKQIADYKLLFQKLYNPNDEDFLKLRKKEDEILALGREMFSENYAERLEQLQTEAAELEQKYNSKMAVFENAFEWRYEFPEVCDAEGKFVGFDAVIGNPPYIQLQSMKEISEQLKRFSYETYEKMGDIYSLFYEKGNTLLKDKGHLAYITSNKWLRAGYGKSTRNYFLQHTQPQLLIDLGSGIFDEATVDSNILIFQKQTYQTPFDALDMSKEKDASNLELFQDKMLRINPQINESWAIANDLEQSLKAKIERIGKPLKEWDISINYGIKTGFNEAFIIDGNKKEELIAQDAKSAEIIKPILRGRDMKRYKAEFADLWLIYIPWHFPLHKRNDIKGASLEAEKEFEKQYPAIYAHLLGYKKQLSARNKAETGIRYEWYALQRWGADYYEEFEKEKIVWGNLCLKRQYALAPPSMLINAPSPFINTNSKYLLAILNSIISDYYIKKLGVTRNGGYFEYKPMFVEKFPVPIISEEEQKPFIELVDKILAKKEKGEDTLALEKEIDQLVYALYALTPEEIALVEG